MKRKKLLAVVPLPALALALTLAMSAPVAALASADPGQPLTVTNLSESTVNLDGIAPGDTTQWAAEAYNAAAAPSSFSVEILKPGAGKLTTNDVNGLWLEFALCPKRLTSAQINGVRSFSCPVASTPLGNAPAGSEVTGSLPATIAGNETVDVLVTVRYSESSNNTFQNSTGALTLVIVGHAPGADPRTPPADTGPNYSGLAFTGADAIGAVGAALVTFMIGFLMLVIDRRRRRVTGSQPEPTSWNSP